MTYGEASITILGGIARFVCQTCARFAKTVGCLAIIAGFVVAGSILQLGKLQIEAARYHESALPAERLQRVQSLYGTAQKAILEFQGTTEFPADYSVAAFTPKFPARFVTDADFQNALQELSRTADGKRAMERFVTDRFEKLVMEIQRVLRAHASSITPPKEPASNAPLPPPAPPAITVFAENLDSSRIEESKETLGKAAEVLGTLKSSAENPENKKKLEDAVAELARFEKLFPKPVFVVPPAAIERMELTNAEKVAQRLDALRGEVRQAVLSSWALNEAYDQALQTVENERVQFRNSDLRVRLESQRVYRSAAAAVAMGMMVGLFFFLIGDWTQKAATEVIEYWSDLIPDFNGSSSEVYGIIEEIVKQREVPGLECTREFWHEGGAVSAKREYLRFAHERQCHEICGAQFGTGFFISYRVTTDPLILDPLGILLLLLAIAALLGVLVSLFGLEWGAITLVLLLCTAAFVMRTAVARGLGDLDRVFMKTPLLGPLYELFLRPMTYYRIDSAEMYQKAVRDAVAEAFQSIFPDRPTQMVPGVVQPPIHPAFTP